MFGRRRKPEVMPVSQEQWIWTDGKVRGLIEKTQQLQERVKKLEERVENHVNTHHGGHE